MSSNPKKTNNSGPSDPASFSSCDKKKIREIQQQQNKFIKKNTTQTSVNISITLTSMTEYLIELQKMEKELYVVLEKSKDMTTQEQNEILVKIDQLTTKREKLYKDLLELSQKVNQMKTNSAGTYKNQLALLTIAEKQLNEEKAKLRTLSVDKYNKLRMVQINNYYNNRYEGLIEFMRLAIVMLLGGIVILLIGRYTPVPGSLISVIMIFYIALTVVVLTFRYLDIARRDANDFEQYDWDFNAQNPPTVSSGESAIGATWKGDIDLTTCVGESCCGDGLTYDSKNNVCILPNKQSANASSSATTAN